MKEVPGNVLDKYLLWHALNGHKENMELLTQTIGEENFKEMYSLEKVLKEFIPLLALDTHVVQLHISNDRKTIRQKGSFDTQKKINPFRYSHGKGLFSVRVLDEDFGEAFHLQHSLTQVPHNGVREGELYLNPKVDYKLKSQHAFCASITAANVRSFMKSLAASSPQVVIVNLDRDLIKHRVGDENMALIDKIVTPPFSKVILRNIHCVIWFILKYPGSVLLLLTIGREWGQYTAERICGSVRQFSFVAFTQRSQRKSSAFGRHSPKQGEGGRFQSVRQAIVDKE